MRIPFIKRMANPEKYFDAGRIDFIRQTKGGSSFLFAGTVFWLIGALVSALSPSHKVTYIIYAGLFVPVIGVLVAKLQNANIFIKSPYTSLANMIVFVELAAIPIMLYLRHSDPGALPAILLLLDGAHLIIYMWLHLDYYYFIAGYLKIILALVLLFTSFAKGDYTTQMLLSGVVSLAAAVLISRDSQRTLQLYRAKKI